MRWPAALPAIALLCGAAAGWLAPAAAGTAVTALALLAWGASVALLARPPGRGFIAAAALGFSASGMLLGAQATRTAEDSGLAAAYADGGGLPVVVTGRLLRDALPSEYGARLSVAVELVRNDGRDVPLAGGLQATVGGRFVAERIADWTAGRRIRMPVLLRRAPRYLNPGTGDQARRTAWRGVALLGSVKSALLVEVLGRGTRWQEAAAPRAAMSGAPSTSP